MGPRLILFLFLFKPLVVVAATTTVEFKLPWSGPIIDHHWDKIIPQVENNVRYVLETMMKCSEIQKNVWRFQGQYFDRLLGFDEAQMKSAAVCDRSYTVVGTIDGYPWFHLQATRYIVQVYDEVGLNVLATYRFADGALELR